ncbi:MAG: hypothetical protein HZT40_18090 [Candidatus Thiothrix singaporensis]|uniref:Uncharacterized protein n=1 Tax=Candidatus Thiothrix singaporensis TaxID=2799669 RepID=A0A7L6AVS2_9GAMM|nr:MAG: hypothetical protein HZT40_18090 [Candidatus Thiothrix singaporensis]
MERQQYTVTAAELPRQIKRLGVPQRAIIHFGMNWKSLKSGMEKGKRKSEKV